MASCTENLSKLYILLGCRLQVRADLQLPAFVNQTNVINCGNGTFAKSPTVQHSFFMHIFRFVILTQFPFSSLAFPLECPHTWQLFLAFPSWSSTAFTTTVYPLFFILFHFYGITQPCTLAFTLLSTH